jgi:hypothetical protein
MTKTILLEVAGFTPVMDIVAADVGLIGAAIFGTVWRYCQMSTGTCTASNKTLAAKLNLSRSTIRRYLHRLEDLGYIERTGKPTIGDTIGYRETGKAGLDGYIAARERATQ